MRETGRVAIARVVIRSKEALVALRPMDDHVLGMSTMLFPDEVVDPDSIDEIAATADVEVTKRELDIAKQLVESLAGPFDSSKYHDTYRQDVLDLIERKAAGEEIAVQPAADEEEEPVPDLMAALKASLDAVRDKEADGNGARQGQEGAGQAEGQVLELAARARRPQPRASARRGRRVRPPRVAATPPSPAPRACAAPTAPARASRAGATGAASASSTRDGEPVDDDEVLQRIHELVDPAGVGGRVDLPVPGRPHPGDRRRRGRAQAVPLPPALARAPRHGEVRGHGRLRAHAAAGCASASRPSSPRATSSPTTACCACAVRLLDRGFFRVGGEDYAVRNESYGLATMKKSHVSMRDGVLVFDYPAKSGKRRVQAVIDPVVAEVVRDLKRRRGGGDELLAYKRGRRWADLRSEDINAWLKQATGKDVSAKDFRTWAATVLAAVALAVSEEAAATKTGRKRAITRAIKEVAHYLGNTPAVARASYIDPRVFDRYRDGEAIDYRLVAAAGERNGDATAIQGPLEKAVLKLLEG